MFELVQVGDHTYYVNSGAKVGIYRASENGVYIIDSGNDRDAGKKIKKILESQGWTLLGIINTHSNADHIGGNQFLQKQYGCKVFAPGIEGAFTSYPVLEPAFLYGGYPFAELRHKFLMAQPSEALGIDAPSFPKELEAVPLPGHFFDMIGIKTPDGVFFAADCVSSEATLEKYQIGFIYDVAAYLETLDKVEKMEAALFVPAHADVCGSMAELCAANRSKVLEICCAIREICRVPSSFETVLKCLFEHFALTMSYEQHVLVGSTVRSYLSYLKDGGALAVKIEDNSLLWITPDENG